MIAYLRVTKLHIAGDVPVFVNTSFKVNERKDLKIINSEQKKAKTAILLPEMILRLFNRKVCCQCHLHAGILQVM